MILYAALRDACRELQEVSAIYVHYCFYRQSISQERVLQKIVDEALVQSATIFLHFRSNISKGTLRLMRYNDASGHRYSV